MSDPNQQFQAPPPPSIQAEPERRRPANMIAVGVVLFVLGIVILCGGIFKIIAGGALTGAAVSALGILLFALGFVPLPEVSPDQPMGLFAKLTGIFFEPTNVFRNLRAHPRWAGALLIIAILNSAYVAAFYQRLTPERIVTFTMDKVADSPFKIPEDKMAEARQNALDQATQPVQRVSTAVKSVVGAFWGVAILAALYLLGVLAFGGRMNFWQAMAVTVYAYLPVAIIGKVVSFIILFIKSPDDIHPLIGQETLVQDNLGILFASKEHPVLFVAASAIGVLSFYKLWLTAKGLHEGGGKVGSSAGWSVAITFWLLGLLLGVGFAALFPSFLS
jgi:hypothetical protein